MIAVMSIASSALWNEQSRAQMLAPGEALFRAGDPVLSLYLVEDGAVNLVRSLPHGAELTLQRAGAGAVLAEASLFALTYHCDALAGTRARVRSIPVSVALAALSRDPALVRAFAAHLASEVQGTRARAEILSLKTVAARLDAWLHLGDGRLPKKGKWREIAAEIGVSPEALYRELAKRQR
jgi:CRP-like cAMP-binding protein